MGKCKDIIHYLCQDRQVLVLHQSGSVGGQSSFLEIPEHVEQMNGSYELDDGISQELKPLVVVDVGLSLVFFAKPWHDADESVDAWRKKKLNKYTHLLF